VAITEEGSEGENQSPRQDLDWKNLSRPQSRHSTQWAPQFERTIHDQRECTHPEASPTTRVFPIGRTAVTNGRLDEKPSPGHEGDGYESYPSTPKTTDTARMGQGATVKGIFDACG
jgi:hypothetical protein